MTLLYLFGAMFRKGEAIARFSQEFGRGDRLVSLKNWGRSLGEPFTFTFYLRGIHVDLY
ncbi:MAG: hypothetical protein PT118_11470 [Aphanizomenon gracile PMC644.10]|nr:hypothetical protein [Aphanizomenon gracile PMC644.10]